jgi:hypothetical protein
MKHWCPGAKNTYRKMKAFRRVACFSSIGSAATKVNDAEVVIAKVIKWCIDSVPGLTSALYLNI